MSSKQEGIRIDQHGIGEVLKNNLLSMPPNQREYSWDESQITSLFQDIAKAIKDSEGSYFLGTIVGIPSPDGATVQVIDGQQRLATTAIFLSAIRNYLKDTKPMIAQAIERFLFSIDRGKECLVPNLKLSTVDNEYFRSLIAADAEKVEPTRPSHRLIEQAFALADKQVNKIVSLYEIPEHGDALNKWIDYIEKEVRVLLLTVSSSANAYKMFETLNDRGLKTTQSDLVKNYLYGRSGDRFDEVQQKWEFMRGVLETLDSRDITIDFLRHALSATNGYIKEDQVYEITERLANSEQGAVDYVRTMERLSQCYVAIHMPEHEKWNNYLSPIRRAIRVLLMFNIKPMKPLLMAIADKFDKKEAGLAYEFMITMSVRLLIASSTRSGSIFETLGSAAKEVYEGEIVSAGEVKEKLSGITPTDTAFVEAFSTYRSSKAIYSRYFLRSLEMAAKDEKDPWFIPNDDQQDITLEHILPRKPENNWPEFSDEDVSMYVNRLGNMVLLQHGSNSDLKSQSYDEKIVILGASPYVLTAHIKEYAEWSTEAIKQRQIALAGFSPKAWPL